MKKFSLARAGRYLAAEAFIHRSRILVMAGALAAWIFLTHFFSNPGEPVVAKHSFQIFLLFWILLPIMGSSLFQGLHLPLRNRLELTLPVSTAERYLSKWFASAVLFPAAAFLGYYALSWIMHGFDRIAMASVIPYPGFTAPHPVHLKLALGGILFSSAYFFGGVFFRSSQMTKTFFSLAGIGAFLSMLLMVGLANAAHTAFVTGKPIESLRLLINGLAGSNPAEFARNLEILVWTAGGLTAAGFWTLSWFRLKGLEARSGIRK